MKKQHLVLSILALSIFVLLAAAAPVLAQPPYTLPCLYEEWNPNCEEPPVLACSPNPCAFGTCSEDARGYTCSCFTGWQGNNCDIPTTPPSSNYGMTWTRLNQQSNNITHVGSDSLTDAYNGDTPTTSTLPILCIYQNGSPLPSGVTPGFFDGWSKGHVALSLPVAGTSLTSLSVANSYCSGYLGTGWRMAEFHDGWYGSGLIYQGGWSFQSFGTIPSATRFWVHINDQLANPWN